VLAALVGCGGSNSNAGIAAVNASPSSGGTASTAPAGSAPSTAAAAATVTLSSALYSAIPSTTATLNIERSGSTAGTVTVGYATADETALAGNDYTAARGSVTWADGDGAAKAVAVAVTGKGGGKQFGFSLTSITGRANFGSPAAATVKVSAPAPTSTPASAAPPATASATPLANASGAPFPRIGVQAIEGLQYFPPANDARLAQYGFILIGGNYAAWVDIAGRTRDELVQSLKNQTHSGRNALTPIVFQYENANEMNLLLPWFPEWTNAVKSNNWFLYESGASGTLSRSVWNPAYALIDPHAVVGTDRSTGLSPYALVAKLLYQRYYLGTGSGGARMASRHLDGYFLDNLTQRNVAGSAADWERNHTNPSATDPTATAAVTLGKAQYPIELAAIDSGIVAGGNTEFAYNMSPRSVGGLGMTFSNLSGRLGMSMQQFLWATPGGQSNVLQFAGFSAAMTWYETQEAHTRTGGYVLVTGGVRSSDYKLVRYSLALTLMRDGWAVYAIDNSGRGWDLVDPSRTATYPEFDEFWGGTLETAGYLGASSGGAQGAEQSQPWSQGVWRRDFDNGIVLVNPGNNATQTVELGGVFHHLRGGQAPQVNNGSAVTSVTIAPGDGLILLRRAPP
jgi:hypothetical protein